MQQTLQIGILEDDLQFMSILSSYLHYQEGISMGWSVNSVRQFLAKENKSADVILLDISLGGDNGLEAIHIIKKELPDVPILMLSMHNDLPTISTALTNGAAGYITKFRMTQYLRDAIQEAYRGGAFLCPESAQVLASFIRKPLDGKKDDVPTMVENIVLTEKERFVVDGLMEGLTYNKIASNNEMSVDNVRYYIKQLYKKFGVHKKVELVQKVVQHMSKFS